GSSRAETWQSGGRWEYQSWLTETGSHRSANRVQVTRQRQSLFSSTTSRRASKYYFQWRCGRSRKAWQTAPQDRESKVHNRHAPHLPSAQSDVLLLDSSRRAVGYRLSLVAE